MPLEDFTTYTEVDIGSDITVTPSKVDVVALPGTPAAYVYEDKGVDFFDGDFEFLFELQVDNNHFNNLYVCSVANGVGTYADLETGDLITVIMAQSGGNPTKIYLLEIDGGSQSSSLAYTPTVDTVYYIRLKRDESIGTYGRIYCDIYPTENDRTNETNAEANLFRNQRSSKKDYRYIYAVMGRGSGFGLNNGFIQNLDLTGPIEFLSRLGQQYTLNAPALNESIINQQYALTAPALEEGLFNQLYVLNAPGLVEGLLNQQYVLDAPVLVDLILGQQYGLSAPALEQGVLNQWYFLGYDWFYNTINQQWSVTGTPVDTIELVDVYYLFDIGEYRLAMSSFQGRVRSNGQDYLSIVIPNGFQYVSALEEQVGTDMIITRGGTVPATGATIESELLRAPLETIRYDRGAVSNSVTLVGHRDVVLGTSNGVAVQDIVFIGSSASKRRVRARFDAELRPGDQIEYPDETLMGVGEISYMVSVDGSFMEIIEADT